MYSSSHIVIIIISLNLLQTRISYLNHLAIFVSCDSISTIIHKKFFGGFLIIKICTEQGRNLLLVVSFKSVYAEQGRTSCWLFSKFMPSKELCLLLAFPKISQSVYRTRNYASCWLFFSKSLKVYVPNKELCLLLALSYHHHVSYA